MIISHLFDYFLVGGSSFSVVFLLTPLVRKTALKLLALDRPNKRKVHVKLITKLGGVAIFIGFLVSSCLVLLLNFNEGLLNVKEFLTFLISASLIFMLGLYDDLRGADAKVKLIVQAIAALIMVRMGLIIDNIDMFGLYFRLPDALAAAVTIFWFVLVTNAVNLIDGIDGLAAGIVFIASLGFFLAFGLYDHPLGFLFLCLGFAHLAFLAYNFPPAKIFMGDCGSLTAGFILASVPLLLKQQLHSGMYYLVIPVIILFVPLLDVFLAICRRLARKRHVFQADSNHIHHFLLKKGFSQRGVLYILYSVSSILSFTALIFRTMVCRS